MTQLSPFQKTLLSAMGVGGNRYDDDPFDAEAMKKRKEEQFQQRVAQDMAAANKLQSEIQGVEGNARQLYDQDPGFAASERENAMAAALKGLEDKYGAGVQQRQMGPHSDLNIDPRQLALLAKRQQEAAEADALDAQGMSADGRALRKRGESAPDYVRRVMNAPRGPSGRMTKMPHSQQTADRKPSVSGKIVGLNSDQIEANKLGKAKRAERRAVRDQRMAVRRENQLQKALQDRNAGAFNSLTRGMEPKDKATLAATVEKFRFDAEQKEKDRAAKSMETEMVLDQTRRKAAGDLFNKWSETYPGASKQQRDEKMREIYAAQGVALHGPDQSPPISGDGLEEMALKAQVDNIKAELSSEDLSQRESAEESLIERYARGQGVSFNDLQEAARTMAARGEDGEGFMRKAQNARQAHTRPKPGGLGFLEGIGAAKF